MIDNVLVLASNVPFTQEDFEAAGNIKTEQLLACIPEVFYQNPDTLHREMHQNNAILFQLILLLFRLLRARALPNPKSFPRHNRVGHARWC